MGLNRKHDLYNKKIFNYKIKRTGLPTQKKQFLGFPSLASGTLVYYAGHKQHIQNGSKETIYF